MDDQERKLFLLFIAILLLLGFPLERAQSRPLFEPYLGYQTGAYENGTKEMDAHGFGIGARLYYVFLGGLAAGGELQLTMLETGESPEEELEQNQVGLSFGVIPKNSPIRVWGTLFPYDVADISPGGELKGSGYKLGVGFHPLPPLSFNFEYKRSYYDKIEENGVDRNLAIERHITTLNFSLSFLFTSW